MVNSKRYWLGAMKRQILTYLRIKRPVRDKSHVKSQYSMAGTRDLDFYFDPEARRTIVYQGRIQECHPSVVRDACVDLIARYLQKRGCKRVLEVGAGTGINLFLLHKKLPHLELQGVDLVSERIETGIEFFRSRCGYVPPLSVADITDLPFEENSFDAVFSVHCLEQINRYVTEALAEVRRVSNGLALFLEPDWKGSNLAQKLFLLNNDYLRGLGRYLKRSNQPFTHKPLNTYSNPLNRTGLFVVECSCDVGSYRENG